MLRYEIMPEHGIVVLSPQGPLSADDFAKLTRAVDLYIQERGPLKGLLVEAHRFPGWDSFAALLSHLRFVKDHHRLIERFAAVSDGAFAKIGPAIAKHFVAAEVRRFDEKDRQAAMEWVRGSGAPSGGELFGDEGGGG
ncbi:MAG: STAS/SEC14 domain-containing protein [Planctomycetes bacterium]|nr:STAS/SEC14 domain-containing protein [Planctomycetota bacterium]